MVYNGNSALKYGEMLLCLLLTIKLFDIDNLYQFCHAEYFAQQSEKDSGCGFHWSDSPTIPEDLKSEFARLTEAQQDQFEKLLSTVVTNKLSRDFKKLLKLKSNDFATTEDYFKDKTYLENEISDKKANSSLSAFLI